MRAYFACAFNFEDNGFGDFETASEKVFAVRVYRVTPHSFLSMVYARVFSPKQRPKRRQQTTCGVIPIW